MKNKGFTLIELLAVIVILAIVALIATPIILNIITDARQSAGMRSAEAYLDTVELAAVRKNLVEEFGNVKCHIQSDANLSCYSYCRLSNNNETAECNSKSLNVDISNQKPEDGVIIIENGQITQVRNMKIGDRYYTSGRTGSMVGSDSPIPRQCGDVNDDDLVNEEDLALVTKAAASKITLSGENFKYADVNGDGVLDGDDPDLMYSVVVNKVSANSFSCSLN